MPPNRFEEPGVAEFTSWSLDATCAVCDEALDVHQVSRGKTCNRPECRLEFLKTVLRLEREKQSRIERIARDHRAELAQAGHDGLEALPTGIVPANRRPLTRLPAARRRAFEDRLRSKIDEAMALLADNSEAPSASKLNYPAYDGALLPVLGGACGVCRGDCCPQGRDHAFITPETITRYLDREPDAEPEKIVADYVSHLEDETYEGSCVYHGRNGCYLPRSMRSDTCNNYLCEGLNLFRRDLEHADASAGLVVAMADEEVLRSATVSERQSEYHQRASKP